MPQQDGAVYINTKINTDGVDKGVKVTEKKFKGMTENVSGMVKKIAGLMAGAFAVGKLIAFGKEAINLGSDLAEVQNVVDVTFGDLNGEINDFAKNAIAQFGLSETSAKQFSSTMGAMLKSMGFTSREAADMGMNLAGLAGDIASFYNLDASEAFAKIRSGLSGETEPLKQLGINLNVANLEQYALTKGIKKSYNAMTQQEQALLRYNYLLSVTSDAQGDFARTSKGWANQTRILSENFNSLKATLGQGLINLFTPVLNVINQIISRLTVLAERFKAFTEQLTGSKAQVASVNKTAEAIEGLAAATEEAQKAQEGYLSGLDEIAKFGSDSANAAATQLPGVSDVGQQSASGNDDSSLKENESLLDNMLKTLKKLIKKAKELSNIFKGSFQKALADSSDKLSDIKTNIQSIGESVEGIFTDSDVQNAASGYVSSLAQAIGTQLGTIAGIGTTIASTLFGGIRSYFDNNSDEIKGRIVRLFNIGERINEITSLFATDINEVFGDVFGSESAQGIVENVIGIFGGLLGGVSEFLGGSALDIINRLVKTFDDNKDRLSEALGGSLEGLESTTTSIRGLVDEITETILPDLRSGFNGLLDDLRPLTDFLKDKFFDALENNVKPALKNVAQIVTDVKNVFDQLWNQVLVPLGNFLRSVLSPSVEKIEYVFRSVWDNALKPLGDGIRDVFMAAWKAVVTYGKNVFIPFWKNLIVAIQWLWDNLLKPLVDYCWNSIKPTFDSIMKLAKNLIEDLKRVLKGAFDFISGIFSGDWGQAWQGLKDVLAGQLNILIDGLNWVLEQPFKGINWLLRKLKGIEILGAKPFGWITELEIPQIPRLATGAVIPPNAPFMAMLGDQRNGNNLEMPESLLRKIVREESGGSIDGNMTVKVYLSGRQIYEEVMRIADLVRAQSGRNSFEGA